MHRPGPDYRFEAFHAIENIDDEGFLFNWSKTNLLAPLSKVFQPTNEQELRSILLGGYETVRVVGSTLSFEPVHSVHGEAGPAALIDLRSWTGQVAVGEGFVTYKAATSVDQLYADLIEMNRMLPACPGVIGIQTLAGALGTGTHGQGLRQSSLGDAVLSMKVMLADGRIQLVERDDPRFGAFILSMGCLGIVLEVSFRTVPNVIMKCSKLTVDQEWLIANHERLNREHLFVKTWWFAWTGEAHVWLVDPASKFEAQAYRAAGCLPVDLGSNAGPALLLDPTVEATMLKMGADTKNEALDGRHIETMRRFKNGNDLIGNVYQLLCKGIPAPQINCEVSVPFAKSSEAFSILRQWQHEHPGVLHYPFILRCCGASEAWLSPAYGQPVCWIGFLVYLAADGQFARGSLDWMDEVQARLARLGGAPHMGKHFSPEIYKLSERTRWRDFDRLRKGLDPNALFENQFVKRLFAHSGQEAAG
jgi:FAD/FMN-containing dehydrogenase